MLSKTVLLVPLLLLAIPRHAGAAQQTLVWQTETDYYELSFDDQVIPKPDLQRIALLSPYIPPDIPSPPFLMVSSVERGKWDKWIVATPLEQCNTPGYTCGDPLVDRAYLKNASHNLQRSRRDLQTLQSEIPPPVLDPVRKFLLATLRFTLDVEQARLDYYQSGNVALLKEVTCRYCDCRGNDDSALQSLINEPKDRPIEVRGMAWRNKMNDCFRKHADKGYPMASWASFIAQFKIKETFHFKPVP